MLVTSSRTCRKLVESNSLQRQSSWPGNIPQWRRRAEVVSALRRRISSIATLSGVRIDSSRWEQDRDHREDGQAPPRGTSTAVVVCAAQHEGEPYRGATQSQHSAYSPGLLSSNYHQFQHLKRFLAGQHFPSGDDMQTAGSALGWWISSTTVYRNSSRVIDTCLNFGGPCVAR
ncbi:hypothetical protein AVEN_217208-1 [Araneus ventricosus]|uniref:Uncharacterized protein n=1 Tax=Araneus ventricosus TaxID=182803 RepID=A0A4Y2QZJ4_ARAVE|nr:hypothetical protein AVEN_217208-1 [Araneus ventricosus]